MRTPSRYLIRLFVLASLLSLAARPAVATSFISRVLAATTNDFAAGKLNLTQLAADGGVELARLDVPRPWFVAPQRLCTPTALAGSANFTTINPTTGARRTFIYSLGGVSGASAAPVIERTVCRAEVLDAAGATSAWLADAQALPETRSLLGAAAVPLTDGSGRGMLYAIGGRAAIAPDSQRATIYQALINVDGSLGAWSVAAHALPTPRDGMLATAFTDEQGTATRADDRSFLYVIGGYRTTTGASYAFATALKAAVNPDGTLAPFMAQPAPPLPVPAGAEGCAPNVGIHSAGVTTMIAVTPDGNTPLLVTAGGVIELGSGDTTGGCQTVAQVTDRMFVAEIDAATGNLAWQGQPDQQYALHRPLRHPRLIDIKNKIFVAGGFTGPVSAMSPTNEVAYTFVTENLILARYPDAHVLVSDAVMPASLAGHGMELVVVDGRPLAYLLGGYHGGAGTATSPQDTVMVGPVGLEGDFIEDGGSRASHGIYLSQRYDLGVHSPLVGVDWTAAVSATAAISTDVRLAYRMADTISGLGEAPWTIVDGDTAHPRFSRDGANSVTADLGLSGRYIQFSADLTTNHTAVTPRLLRVSVDYVIDGNPSLFVSAAQFPRLRPGAATAPTVTIANRLPAGSTFPEPILDANVSGDEFVSVALYAFAPGTQVVTPTGGIDTPYPATYVASARIETAHLPADAAYTIPPDVWRTDCAQGQCQVDWSAIFNQPGAWTVIVVADSAAEIREPDLEADNVRQLTVQVDYPAYLPLITR